MPTWKPIEHFAGFSDTCNDSVTIELERKASLNLQIEGPEGEGLGFLAPQARSYPLEAVTPSTQYPGGPFSTLEQSACSFIYMDCGRWGGDEHTLGGPKAAQRGFGLVWKNWVALCQFFPDKSMSTASNYITNTPGGADRMKGNLINDLIDALRTEASSVKVLKWEMAPAPPIGKTNSGEYVYVILPDLHLPVVTKHWSGGDIRDMPPMGRSLFPKPNAPAFEGLADEVAASKWYDNLLKGDIFGKTNNPGSAAHDLSAFMDLLFEAEASKKMKIWFCQTGDFYDLWIGMDRFFSRQSTQKVVLQPRDGLEAYDFTDHWVTRTDANFPELIKKMKDQHFLAKKTFLWGNHDCYLACRHPSSWWPFGFQRKRAIRDIVAEDIECAHGIYIEHGHRGDQVNRDGAPGYFTSDGQFITNGVFYFPGMRDLEDLIWHRNSYIIGAAFDYAVCPNFSVYVMAHTHRPFLTKVKIAPVLRMTI